MYSRGFGANAAQISEGSNAYGQHSALRNYPTGWLQDGYGYPFAGGGNQSGGMMHGGQTIGGYGSSMSSVTMSVTHPQGRVRALAPPVLVQNIGPPPPQTPTAHASTPQARGATQMPPTQQIQPLPLAVTQHQGAPVTATGGSLQGPSRLMAAIDSAEEDEDITTVM